MFESNFEWEQAPGVASPALAKTWARMEIVVDAKPASRYWSEATQSVRAGVYVSLLPLASWIARNWWVLLYQGARVQDVSRGPRPVRNPHARHWFGRHNCLFAREGMAYPDMTFLRIDDRVGILWRGDPGAPTMPGRFIDTGLGLVPLEIVEAQLHRLIEAVRVRVAGCEHEPGVHEFLADWQALGDSRRTESEFCQRLGMLGLDPYEDDIPDGLEPALATLAFDEMVTRDLLATTTSTARLDTNVRATREMLDALEPAGGGLRRRAPRSLAGHAYAIGFERARWLRQRLRLSPDAPVPCVDDVVCQALGPDFSIKGIDKGDADVEGVVRSNGAVGAVVWSRGEPEAERFHKARVLHHALFATTDEAPTRLLTRSHDWQQSASRSFAAELLAPASALEARIGGLADWDSDDAKLARDFVVSPYVIRHQLENHGLA